MANPAGMEQKEPQVRYWLSVLQSSLDDLDKQIDCLDNKLIFIGGKEGVPFNPESEKNEPLCELADNLKSKDILVRKMVRKIDTILREIEI